jgi:hypothetical protein
MATRQGALSVVCAQDHEGQCHKDGRAVQRTEARWHAGSNQEGAACTTVRHGKARSGLDADPKLAAVLAAAAADSELTKH